ncbi:hypothetical protein LX97_02798 [Nonlabens dokdonensis]|uniref:C1q domain-containing protein n=2 Tax=Nonlabens dokdonensis TaxID=328515 RepID=L7WHK6_NONDD|nr:hypothetical protein [Nonlabens dokdonensis]AGC78473.1 hypothetical protein DDD_3346 [Nonlabens dokdonensis DSW-6]PZX38217.1 hypothetical protein LX97_02798 [Nonlabens dokdonensis]
MKFFYCILFSFASLLSYSQVGIGTAAPTADLEIISNTGLASGEFNGIIIPKVPVLPTGAALPSVAQTGLILYLDSNDAAEGFYYFNGTSYQNVNATSAFYTDGTTDNATSTTSDIVRTGRTSFGTESVAAAVVTVENPGAVASEERTILSVTNRHTSVAAAASTPDTKTLDLTNTSTTGRDKIGIANEVSVSGLGAHIGIDNVVAVNNNSNFTNYGIRNVIGSSTTSGQDINGISTRAGNAGATGTVYGIRSIALNDGSNNSFSGYFQGDSFAIRNAGDTDGYTMPVDSGTAGQVLTTDGTGAATWSGLSDFSRADVSGTTYTLNNPAQGDTNDDWEDVVFSNETVTSANYDNSNGVYTAPADGVYNINAMVTSDFTTGDTFRFGINVVVDYDGGDDSYVFYKQIEYSHSGTGTVSREVNANISLLENANIKIQFLMPDSYANFTVDEFGPKTNLTITKL